MSTIYSINTVRTAVASALLKLQNMDQAIEKVSADLGLPPEAVRGVVDEAVLQPDEAQGA